MHAEQKFSFHDLKAFTEALFTQLRLSDKVRYKYTDDLIQIIAGNTEVGTAYRVSKDVLKNIELDNEAYIAEINLDLLAEAASNLKPIRYKPVPKFPAFEYDIALIVDAAVNAGDMEEFISAKAGPQLISIQVFDVFEGAPLAAGEKSIAFRLLFQDDSKTLTIHDVEPRINKVTKGLAKTFGAQLRS